MGPRQNMRKRPLRAFNMIEVMVALFVFAAMAMMISAVIPTAARATRSSNNHAVAMQLIQRKLDQLQDDNVGFDNLKLASMQHGDWKIIDSGGTTTGTFATNALPSDNYSVTAYFTQVDRLREFFPQNAVGTLVIQSWLPSEQVAGGCSILTATARITWQTNGQPQQTVELTTLLTKADM